MRKSIICVLATACLAGAVLAEKVDYVIHTGDLVDFQSRANFDLVKKYWGETVLGSMGNHEFYSYVKNDKSPRNEAYKARSWDMLREEYWTGDSGLIPSGRGYGILLRVERGVCS